MASFYLTCKCISLIFSPQKNIVEFTTTFKKVYLNSNKIGKERSMNSEKDSEGMESIIDNKKQKGISVEELKKLKNYENVSDQEAQEIVYAIKNLALIFYEHLNQRKKQIEIQYNKAA